MSSIMTACKTAWLQLLVMGVMNACFCDKIYSNHAHRSQGVLHVTS